MKKLTVNEQEELFAQDAENKKKRQVESRASDRRIAKG